MVVERKTKSFKNCSIETCNKRLISVSLNYSFSALRISDFILSIKMIFFFTCRPIKTNNRYNCILDYRRHKSMKATETIRAVMRTVLVTKFGHI